MSGRTVVSRLIAPVQRLSLIPSRTIHAVNSQKHFGNMTSRPFPVTKHHFVTRQPVASFTSDAKPKKKKTIKVTFVDRDGDEHTVDAKMGDSLLEVAKEYDIDLEGACEGTLSCSTCHLIMDQEWFDKIPDPLTEEEQDMLDLAYGLTDTSRLGCQILATRSLEGIRLKVPTETRDVRDS